MTHEILTKESPAKVAGLLGVALTSMFFLFAVSVSNANFSQTENTFPDPFSAEKVVSFLDNTSNSFSGYVDATFVRPTQNSFAVYQDNLNYIMDNAGPSILAVTGLSGLADVNSITPKAQVAGASTVEQPQSFNVQSREGGLTVNALYSLLIR